MISETLATNMLTGKGTLRAGYGSKRILIVGYGSNMDF